MSVRGRSGQTIGASVLACLLLFAVSASAESILQFDLLMQRIEHKSQSVQRNLARQDAAAAIADAQDMADMYGQMDRFFQQRADSQRAVRLSRDGSSLAVSMAQLAAQRDFAAASRQALAIVHACRDCHEDYKPLDP